MLCMYVLVDVVCASYAPLDLRLHISFFLQLLLLRHNLLLQLLHTQVLVGQALLLLACRLALPLTARDRKQLFGTLPC